MSKTEKGHGNGVKKNQDSDLSQKEIWKRGNCLVQTKDVSRPFGFSGLFLLLSS